jgi:hypothetical protein
MAQGICSDNICTTPALAWRRSETEVLLRAEQFVRVEPEAKGESTELASGLDETGVTGTAATVQRSPGLSK